MTFKINKQSVLLEMKNLSGNAAWGEENKARNLHQKTVRKNPQTLANTQFREVY